MNPENNADICAVVNQAAGAGRCGKRAKSVLESLKVAGRRLNVRVTQAPGHAIDLARQAWAEGIREFWSVGGDGTVFEVLNGLLPEALEDRIRLGVLPLGTGNSFLRDFGINDEATALTTLREAASRTVDVIRFTHTQGTLFFVNLMSIGFSADVADLTNRRLKPLGAAGYAVAVVTRVASLKPYTFAMRIDAAEAVDDRPCTLISFCNSKFTGGTMMMAPDADPSDGMVDVVRLGVVNRRRLLQAFPRIYKGTHPEMPETEMTRARHIEFVESGPINLMIDGETKTLTPVAIDVLPHAFDLIAP